MSFLSRFGIRKNSAGSTFTRPRINLIEGSNVTLTVADDAGDNEVDVTIAASSGGGGAENITGAFDIEADGSPAYTDAGMSDEFAAGTLDAQWTAVGAGSGTVNIITATLADSVYDLATRSGTLLVQLDQADSVAFRQDAVLGDGEQFICSISIASPGDNPSAGNSMWVGVGMNDNDTDYDAGTHFELFWDGADDDRILWGSGGASGSSRQIMLPGSRAYLRLMRNGSTIYAFWSNDGTCWCPVGTGIAMGAADNTWIFIDSKGVSFDHAPIVAINWFRHVANLNLDPW